MLVKIFPPVRNASGPSNLSVALQKSFAPDRSMGLTLRNSPLKKLPMSSPRCTKGGVTEIGPNPFSVRPPTPTACQI